MAMHFYANVEKLQYDIFLDIIYIYIIYIN